MKTAFAYCRYSSDMQRGESIDAQVRAIDDYAKKHNIRILDYYIDEARSATTDNRPAFKKLFQDIKIRSADALIVHKLDRFARDRYDAANYRHKLKEAGMKLLSVTEQFDGSPESVILESVLEGMAEYYSLNLAREVQKGKKENAYKCLHTGGCPPLGYDVAPDLTYRINPSEAEVIRTIFEMYAADYSYRQIAEHLNAQGFRSKRGGKFSVNSFHDILKNEKYTGVYLYNRAAAKGINNTRNNHESKAADEIIRIEDGMPRIISDELFQEVNRKMTANKRQNAMKKAKTVYLLSGIIFCGECGSRMTGNSRTAGRNKTKYQTYECVCRKKEKTCRAKSIPKDYIEGMVLKYLNEGLFQEPALTEVAEQLAAIEAKKRESFGTDIPTLEKERDAVARKLTATTDLYIDEGFPAYLKERCDELYAKREALTEQIETMRIHEEAQLDVEKIKAYIKKDANLLEVSPNAQKRIIQTYVEKITVTEDEITMTAIVNKSGGDGLLRLLFTIAVGCRKRSRIRT